MELAGAAAVVFGGGGLLGAATAGRLGAGGCHVVVADLAPGKCPPEATFVDVDVREPDAVDAALSVARGLGEVRIVVNCVGVGIVQRTLARDGTRHALEDFRRIVDLNLVAAFTILVAAADTISISSPLEGGERGVIINTSSLAGLEGSAGQIAYGSAKAGVAGMTLPAARDLAPLGIRVVTIAPGGMADGTDLDLTDPRIRGVLDGVVFPRRFGTPDEYALTVEQIVRNGYLNGSVIRLDGAARLGLKH
jgi:NAD(P)-dependent dehydrogenase (short-subunit alcohol dehydrogenase family)